MIRFQYLPIRHQFYLLIAPLLLLTFSIIAYAANKQREHEISESYAIASSVASRIEDDQNSLIAAADQLAAAVSVMPAFRQHEAAETSQLLQQLLATNPRFLDISIMDRSGMVWASGKPSSSHIESYANHRFFINALKTGTTSSGDYTIGNTSQVPSMSFGYPLRDNTGMVKDIMAITIPLSHYSNLYDGRIVSPVSAILLSDNNGTILYSSTNPALIGTQDRDDLHRRMVEGTREGSFEAMGVLGVRRLYAYRKLTLKSESSPYLYVRTGLDKAYVLSEIRRDLFISACVLLPVLISILGCAFYTGKRGILDKIYTLKNATQSIAAGDLDIRIASRIAGGELGDLGTAFDEMAERLKQAGVALEESEKKYRELVENANSIILKCDTQGRVTYVNEYAERYFGFTSIEIVGRGVIGTIVPELDSNGRDLTALVQDLLKNPAAFAHNECECTLKNGERVWISWNNHALLDHDGIYTGILAIGQDISERKRIEMELRMSEQRFRSFVENLNDVVFVLTPAGEFSYVSPNWTEIFGYDLIETIGHSFVPFVHPDDVPVCFEFMRRVFETGQKQSGVEYRVLSRAGTYLWYRANASLIHDSYNDTFSLIGVGRDITQIKQSEETLRQSEEKFSAAFHASPDAISLSRLGNGKFLDINEGFTALTGYRQEEAVGKTALELQLWENHEERLKLLLELRESGTVTGRSFHFRCKDGTRKTGQMAARVININNEPYIIAIIRDMTEHELLQNELIKAQKLESISILAGGIAHNFNNVLTGVIGYISYAKKYAGEKDRILQILESAEKSSYRAAGIARQLLTFSQSGVSAIKPVSLDDLIKESIELFLSGSKVTGIINCSAHHSISLDSQQISQAFNNIVLNALQAMPEGGTLEVTTEEKRLDKFNSYNLPAGDYVRIVFRDTGCGIAKDDLNRVYDPYFTTKESGTGLGLSTCHTIIKRHGGHIGITSEIGKGTTVTVMLPSAPQPENGTRGSIDAGAVEQQAGLSILVMDDEEMIRNMAQQVLAGWGYKVTTCSCGEEAVELYKKSLDTGKAYTLAILDLSVPRGMGGIEAARQILGIDPQACLIASSGYSNDPAITDFGAFGFSAAIAKPYSSEQLASAIESAVEGT